jgi:uncharacterized protein with HEPN domain
VEKASDDLKGNYSNVEWRKVKDARNFYIHSFDFVVWERIWLTIKEELPVLKKNIENIIQILERN